MNKNDRPFILRAGIGRLMITPPLGTLLHGYAPPRPAEAVGDDLHVIAAALEYGDTTVLILSADVCTCPPKLADEIRIAISEKPVCPMVTFFIRPPTPIPAPLFPFRVPVGEAATWISCTTLCCQTQ